MSDLISVIIPVYKVEKYLHKCVDSVLNQTYQNLEIILVDDGSPDNCPAICDEYALKDSRIKVIHQKNAGLSEARNAGIRIANGEYLAFLDSDDYIAPTMYGEMLNLLINTDAELAICNVITVNEDGFIVENNSNLQNSIYTKEEILGEIVREDSVYYRTAWNKLYKRKLFENIRFPKGKLHEDEFVAHQIFYECNKIVTTQHTYYYYVQRADSIMSAKMSVKRLDAIEAFYNRYLFYKKYEELHRYLADLGKKTLGLYMNIASNIEIHSSTEKKRFNEATKMFQEVYKGTAFNGFSKKDYVKYYFPKLWISATKVRKALKLGTKLRHLKAHIKVLTKIKNCDYILLDTPEHGNLGDHAIVLAERQMMEQICGNTGYCEFSANEINMQEEFFAGLIPKDKILLIPGGGFLGDLWPAEEFRIHRILDAFKEHKIVVFPQTVSYDLDTVNGREFLRKSQEIYSKHKDLTVFVREQKSYDFVQQYFPTIKTFLVPDIVLSYQHDVKSDLREGVLLCFRTDKEKSLGAEDMEHILSCLKDRFPITVSKSIDNVSKSVHTKPNKIHITPAQQNVFDSKSKPDSVDLNKMHMPMQQNASIFQMKNTSTVVSYQVKTKKREAEVKQKLTEFASAKLVITDRLHGMIFAAITGTPCIAISNSNGKVKGVYQWIKDLEYIKFMNDISEFKQLLMELNLEQNYNYSYHMIEEKNIIMKNYLRELIGHNTVTKNSDKFMRKEHEQK